MKRTKTGKIAGGVSKETGHEEAQRAAEQERAEHGSSSEWERKAHERSRFEHGSSSTVMNYWR
eukprot:611996-Pleurochrysis_carterae.AAC.6